MEENDKYGKLKIILKGMDSVLVGFSGGVDSTLLLKAALDALGKENVLAVTVASELKPKWEQEEAGNIAQKIGADFLALDKKQLTGEISANPPERCYICRKALLEDMLALAKEKSFKHIILGDNADDLHDYRPGYKASQEMNIRSPLAEAGLTKKEIREISKQFGLPTWDKKPFPCLATRFPFGERITEEKAKNIDRAEIFIRSLGVGDIRVRHHGNVARIEVEQKDFPAIMENKDKIIEKLKSYGYLYISLDLEGFRSGSMNQMLKK